MNSDGEIEWQKTIGSDGYENVYTIHQTTDGGYIIGGASTGGISGDKTETSIGANDYWLVKLYSTGDIQWQNTIGGSEQDLLQSVQQVQDGYILAGESKSGISGDKTEKNINSSKDYWIVKVDNSGNIMWQNTIGGDDSDIDAQIQQTTDGGYIVGGSSSSDISGDKTENSIGGNYDYWVVKLNGAGNIEWQNTIGGSAGDEVTSIQQTTNGDYIIGGYSSSDISSDKTENNIGGYDYWLVKLNSSGTVIWDQTIGGKDEDRLYSIQQITDGGFIVGGSSYSGSSGDKTENDIGFPDYWIIKLSADLCNGLLAYSDADHDGYGDASNSLFVADCILPVGYVFASYLTDCNDNNAAIHPGTCDPASGNSVDDNCDGIIDDGYGVTIYYVDADNDGHGTGGGIPLCNYPGDNYSTNNTDCDDINPALNPGMYETDNGIDDNCSGVIDDISCALPAGYSTPITNVEATSVKFEWDIFPAAISYKLRYKVATTGEWTLLNPHGHAKTVTGLSPNTEYVWQLKTVCGKDPKITSEWSEKRFFETDQFKMQSEHFDKTNFEIYPNPTSANATIHFNLARSSNVAVKILDVNGKENQILVEQRFNSGSHSLTINLTSFAKGIYFVRMITENEIQNQKLIIQ